MRLNRRRTYYCKTCKKTRYCKTVSSTWTNWLFIVCNKCKTTVGCY